MRNIPLRSRSVSSPPKTLQPRSLTLLLVFQLLCSRLSIPVFTRSLRSPQACSIQVLHPNKTVFNGRTKAAVYVFVRRLSLLSHPCPPSAFCARPCSPLPDAAALLRSPTLTPFTTTCCLSNLQLEQRQRGLSAETLRGPQGLPNISHTGAHNKEAVKSARHPIIAFGKTHLHERRCKMKPK